MNDLLITKLCAPPARPNLVPRPRLSQRLDEGLHPSRRLILVSASAGYGKTTLVTEWLQTSQARSAWLSLDEADNDPARFQAYLLAALSGSIGHPSQNQPAPPSLQPVPPEAALTAVINHVAAASEPVVLVLDDYHVIQNPAVHRFLVFMLEHQPANLHLALVTREDPLLPVSRLRAGGQVVEVRQEELRFTLDECAQFLQKVMGIPLTSDDVATLERRTEGWIVGLQLAALSMQGRNDVSGFVRAFSGSSRFILDYLIEEVFERQTQEVKEFLLRTSILRRLCGALCAEVTENANSRELLEHLEQANLFIIPLDEQRGWYRYHHLFAELLRHRMNELEPLSEASLHQRASLWYEAEGFLADAILHALEAKDWERAAGLIERFSEVLLKRGELITLIGWCEKLPGELIEARPTLGLGYAWALALLGQFDKAEEPLVKLETMAASVPPLMGQVAAVQAYVARGKGDNPRAIAKSQQALALMPASAPQRGILALNLGLVYWHEGQLRQAVQVLNGVVDGARQIGNQYGLLTAQIFLARTLASQGELQSAEEMYRQIIQDGGQVPILALAHFDLCGIYYEWNDLAKAEAQLDKGMELCIHSGNVEFQNSGHLLKAFLLQASGKPREAVAEVEISHALARDLNPATRARSAACHAQILLAMGEVAKAEQWVEQMSEDVDAHPFYRFIGLNRPRLLIAQNKKTVASEMLKECAARAAEAGWGYALIAIRLLQSLAAERESALSLLIEAVRAAQLNGYVRTFVDSGPALVPMLQESARRGIAPEYVGRILSAFGEEQKKGVATTQPLVEPLSERELEVLRLITAGLSNREIAARLVISLGTAKTHIHNLCGKMGAHNRTEAAMMAKELGLV